MQPHVHTKEERLLTRTEVEEHFGISKRFLELAVSKGNGPRITRIGRLAKYRPADTRAWLETCSNVQS